MKNNPEVSNGNTNDSDSKLGGGTVGTGGWQDPFQDLEDMPKFDDHMAEMQSQKQSQNENSEKQAEQVGATSEYDTYDEVIDALESLKEQATWRRALSDLADSIKSIRPEDGNSQGWIREFIDTTYPPQRGFRYTIQAITSDEYNQSGREEVAGPNEKRFTIGMDYGYAQWFDASAPLKEVNGFSRRQESDPFPEETDFTVEGKAENQDIPERINDVLYKAFGKNQLSFQEQTALNGGDKYGYEYEKYIEYPDADTLTHIVAELDQIISDIGSEEALTEKRQVLEAKKSEFEKAQKEVAEKEKEATNQQELSKIAETINSGDSLDMESLRLLFDSRYDDDSSITGLRQKLGIDANVIKQLLNSPTFEEHMTEMQKVEQAESSPEMSIEERQKFIEDPEARKAKIQSILQEITPDDLDEDFDYKDYQGDNASDFFENLSDGFIMQHADDLISCGVKPETFDKYIKDWFTQSQASDALIDNLDVILGHVGHGITPDTLMRICQVDPNTVDGDPLSAVAKYILDENYEYGQEGVIDTMLKNGFTADQIISSGTLNTDDIEDGEDILLANGADPDQLAAILEDD